MLMMLMKFSFVSQHFFKFFFRIRIRFLISKSFEKVMLCVLIQTHQTWCRSAKFLSKSKSCSRSGSGSWSWFYFGFQYQTYISYIKDTHQILFGSANSFESYCVHSKILRTHGQTDRRTDIFFACCVLRHTKHEHSSKGKNFFHSCDYNIFSFYILCMWWEKVLEVLKIQVLQMHFHWKYTPFLSISSTLYLKYQTSTHKYCPTLFLTLHFNYI